MSGNISPCSSYEEGADVLGETAELLFGPDSEERRTALVRMGLDKRFVARVSQVFEIGQPALLAPETEDAVRSVLKRRT